MDHLVYGLADLDLDILALADDANICPTELTQQIQRPLRFPAQGQATAVLMAALLRRLLDVLGHTIEAVSGTRTIDPLVGTLVVVVADPVIQPLTGVGERSEHRLFEELAPHCLPEPLDLAQCHRVMRRRAYVLDALLLQRLLEPGLATPGHELAAVVGEDLPRSTPLPDRTLDHFQN